MLEQMDENLARIVYVALIGMAILSLLMISVLIFGPDNIFEEAIESVIETNTGVDYDFTP